MCYALLFFKQSFASEPLYDQLTRLDGLLILKAARDGHSCVFIYNDDFVRELVSIGDVPIGLAMRRREADSACAEGRINLFVRDDFYMNGYVAEDRIILFADELRISCVIRMHGDRDIAHLGLGAGRRDGNGEVFAIAECIELRRAFLIDDLVVRDGGLALRVPVNDAVAAVNETRIIHLFKNGAHRATARFIKRERFARPVERSPHRLYLIHDGVVALCRE